MIRKTGWSTRGRPFTPKEFASSYLKKNFKMSYAEYLQSFARFYKNPKRRRKLLK